MGSGAGPLRAARRRTQGAYERGCAFNFLLTPERDDQVSWGTLERRFLGRMQRGTAGAPLLPAARRLPGQCWGQERLTLRGCERERSEIRERLLRAPHGGARPARPAVPAPGHGSPGRSPTRGEGRVGAGPRLAPPPAPGLGPAARTNPVQLQPRPRPRRQPQPRGAAAAGAAPARLPPRPDTCAGAGGARPCGTYGRGPAPGARRRQSAPAVHPRPTPFAQAAPFAQRAVRRRPPVLGSPM